MVRPRATWPGPPLVQEALRCGGSVEWPQLLEHRPGLAADNCLSREPPAHSHVLEEKTGKLSGPVCGLTFELTGPRRWDGLARAGKMYRVPQAGPRQPAVGGPVVQRGVSRQLRDSTNASADPQTATTTRTARIQQTGSFLFQSPSFLALARFNARSTDSGV